MKLSSYKILTFLFIICSLQANATTCDSITTVIHKGKTCIKYKIDKGNTFYSLSRKYGVSVDELKALNNTSVLGLDQIIYIPTNKKISAPNIHTVAKGETLYMIATTHGISVDKLKKNQWLNE